MTDDDDVVWTQEKLIRFAQAKDKVRTLKDPQSRSTDRDSDDESRHNDDSNVVSHRTDDTVESSQSRITDRKLAFDARRWAQRKAKQSD